MVAEFCHVRGLRGRNRRSEEHQITNTSVVATSFHPCGCIPSISEPGACPGGFAFHGPARPNAVRAVRLQLREWVAAADLDEDTADAVVQLTDEAVTNAVEHATTDGDTCVVDVLANRPPCGSGVAVVVHDDGTWKPPGDPGYRGRGVRLIGLMSDRSTITTSASGTTVRMCWTDPRLN
ncbi:hypothetical protein GCM10023201_03330 [Actinomycetospora corticicola]